jgi:tRNA A37 methylthiotransferase MiaB
MFENTLRIVEECQLTHLHVFPYSPRQGTPAARMPQVEKVLVKERAQQLRTLGEKKLPSTCTIVPVNNAQSLSSVTPEDIRNTSRL